MSIIAEVRGTSKYANS